MIKTLYKGAVSIWFTFLLLSAPYLSQAQSGISNYVDGTGSLNGWGQNDQLDYGVYNGPSESIDLTQSQNTVESSPEDPGPGVPVDGGLSLLLAAGVGYGANRLRKMRMKDEG